MTLAEDTASTSTTHVDTTVAEETDYFYYVRAVNSAGVGDDVFNLITTGIQTVGVPSAPSNLRLAESTRGEVTLTWTAPADDGGSPITGYNIVRKRFGDGPVTLAEDTASTSTTYVDTTVAEETDYFYYVRAVNSAGVGDDVFNLITTGIQTVGVPSAPSNLRLAESTRGEVTLTWTAPTDDGGSPITGYNIVRENGLTSVTLAEDTSTSFVDTEDTTSSLIDTVHVISTSFVDTTVAGETRLC